MTVKKNNQVRQCESEPQVIETTTIVATVYSKARATIVTEAEFTANFLKKIHCSQTLSSNKNRLDHESHYQKNIKKLLDLIHQDCKNELQRLKLVTKKSQIIT